MKQFLLLFLLVCHGALLAQSQVLYEDFFSNQLKDKRKLKIQLPRDYKTNTEKHYPLVIVLDGNYLFEPVAGNVDYLSYWEDMPESIVVGIMQGDLRYDDCNYDDINFFPSGSGEDFFEFIGLELIPHLDQKYRTAQFVVGVGHDFTANFLHYYMFKDPPLFDGYICLSPDLAPLLETRLPVRIPEIDKKLFYYLATGTDDIKDLNEIALMLDGILAPMRSEKFVYYFDNFDNATHYSLVSRGVPNALEKIFSIYRPISKAEFNDVLLNMQTPVHEYLVRKYNTINGLFGLENNPKRLQDLLSCGVAAEKLQQWESVRVIATFSQQDYPDSILGPYLLARYYEENDNPKKAMRIYQGAFDKEELDFITTDLMFDRAEQIKIDFGY